MARPRSGEERRIIGAEASLAGILALLVDAREKWIQVSGDRAALKSEVLLDKAGLSLDEIAAVTGKNYNAVRMSIARSKER